VTVRADIGNSADAVDVKYDKVGSAGGGHGGRRVDFELGAGSGKGLSDKGAHLALDQIEHHAAQTLVGVVNMLGDLDAAMFADGQDAVVVQQRLAARLLVGFDDILEEHSALNLGRNGFLEAGMGDGHLSFHSGENADVNLIFWSIGPGGSCHEQQRRTSGCREQPVARDSHLEPPALIHTLRRALPHRISRYGDRKDEKG
jgi:hypothetical protein